MQLRNIWMFSTCLTFFTSFVFAAPPFEILRSCIDNKPYNEKIEYTRLDGDGVAEKSMDGCEQQYDRLIDGHAFGTLSCNEKFYFVINDQKIDPKLAENYSINPEIQPGGEFSSSVWYKIDYENRSYLCIFSSLSDHGVGGAYNQYYIVENAFDNKLIPKLFYYFLDKDVVPIGSKTL
jgi:hypothetical protein